MKRKIWFIPFTIGSVGFMILGGLGLICYQIGQVPGFYWSMDPLYPFFLIGSLGLAFYSYRRWRTRSEA